LGLIHKIVTASVVVVVLNVTQRSSLAYQFLLVFNAWYLLLFVVSEIAIFIWKGEFSITFSLRYFQADFSDIFLAVS